MRYRITLMGTLAFGLTLIIFIFIKCSKDYAVRDNEEARNLLSNYYPKTVEKEYNLVVRYESKEEPSKWNEFQWKKDNDMLEKQGLLRQVIIDTVISFYNHTIAGFENKHQYFYEAILSNQIKTFMIEPQMRVKKFDEYDSFNKRTGRITTMNCKAVCGYLNVDKIETIQQNNPPYSTGIEYYEKFSPTVFNDIVEYEPKFKEGQQFLQKVTAKRFKDSRLKLVD